MLESMPGERMSPAQAATRERLHLQLKEAQLFDQPWRKEDALGEHVYHPSFAVVTIGNASTRGGGAGGHPLFGASVRPNTVITLELSRAKEVRMPGGAQIMPAQQICRLAMSYEQFGRLVTTMGQSGGVPCTLMRLGAEGMEDPPVEETPVQALRARLRARVDDVTGQSEAIAHEVAQTLRAAGSLRRGERYALARRIEGLLQDVRRNLPFLVEMLDEAMNATSQEYLHEVEGQLQAMAKRHGLAALSEQVAGTLLGAPRSDAREDGGQGD